MYVSYFHLLMKEQRKNTSLMISPQQSPIDNGRPTLKGVHVEGEKITLFADLISDKLGVSCSALSGANIAPEVARDRFSETTVGYRNKEEGEMWHELFGMSPLGKWSSG
jgi:glycerol-3-phosphate dehydrogenase